MIMDQNTRIGSLEQEVLTLKSELATLRSIQATKMDLCRSELQSTKWVGLIASILLVTMLIGVFAK
jgi:hypothetical protein